MFGLEFTKVFSDNIEHGRPVPMLHGRMTDDVGNRLWQDISSAGVMLEKCPLDRSN